MMRYVLCVRLNSLYKWIYEIIVMEGGKIKGGRNENFKMSITEKIEILRIEIIFKARCYSEPICRTSSKNIPLLQI